MTRGSCIHVLSTVTFQLEPRLTKAPLSPHQPKHICILHYKFWIQELGVRSALCRDHKSIVHFCNIQNAEYSRKIIINDVQRQNMHLPLFVETKKHSIRRKNFENSSLCIFPLIWQHRKMCRPRDRPQSNNDNNDERLSENSNVQLVTSSNARRS